MGKLTTVILEMLDKNNLQRDSMIEDDDEIDDHQIKAGRGDSIGTHQMTASDTSSEGSDEQSYTSTGSNIISNEWSINNEIITPILPIECPCREHKGRKLLDIELPINVQQSFQLLFSDNKWINKFEASLKRSEKKCTSWNEEDENNTGKKERICIYTMELDKTFGPKSTKLTETQTYNPIDSDNDGYILIKDITNEGIPYADSFSVQCIYCITKISETKCRLKVHGGITFKKYIFGLIKGVIERSAIAGLDSYYNALNQKIKSDEEQLLTFITEMESEEDPIIAEETLNGVTMNPSHHSEASAAPMLTSNRLADRVISMSNLKEATENPPTSTTAPASTSQPAEVQTVILLLKTIAILLFLIFISNIWFSYRSQPQQIIPSGPSATSLEELAELRKMVTSLESKFNSFLTGAKREL
jgi:hypothetical protein